MRYWMPVLVLTMSISGAALATSYAPTERHDVFSPNGRFVLDVNPETGLHNVYETASRERPLWSFDKPVGYDPHGARNGPTPFRDGPFLLSDDGAAVATIAWRHVQESDLPSAACVTFWNAGGVVREYSFADLCSKPARTTLVGVGPIGSFWRTWYSDVEQDASSFTVTTTDWYAYTFDIRTGDQIARTLVLSNIRYKPGWWVIAAGLVILAFLVTWSLWRRRYSQLAWRRP